MNRSSRRGRNTQRRTQHLHLAEGSSHTHLEKEGPCSTAFCPFALGSRLAYAPESRLAHALASLQWAPPQQQRRLAHTRERPLLLPGVHRSLGVPSPKAASKPQPAPSSSAFSFGGGDSAGADFQRPQVRAPGPSATCTRPSSCPVVGAWVSSASPAFQSVFSNGGRNAASPQLPGNPWTPEPEPAEAGVHVRGRPMPPIRHPCPRRIRPFSPPPPPEFLRIAATRLDRWKRSAIQAALCLRHVWGSRAVQASAETRCHRSQRVDCYSSLTGVQKILGGLGPTLRGVACPWPCLC